MEQAYVRVAPKVKHPKSCDQLRPISITSNLAKVTESLVYRDLVSQVAESLDYLIRVYLVRLYHLIVQWLKSEEALVDLLLVDYMKAFDLIKHLIAATNLKRMGARKHILLPVIDFLRSRCQ